MSAVSYQDGSWVEPESGRTYTYRLWHPSSSPRAFLVLLHGFGEHGGRYRPFAQSLAEEGVCVAAPDFWGHGRSGGARGDLGKITTVIRHLHDMTQAVLLPKSGLRQCTLMGHSFGGLAAITWALHHPSKVERLVVQSPLLEVGFPIPIWKSIGAMVLALCRPQLPLAMDLNADWLTHDQAVVRAYQEDPLVHNRMSAGTYQAVLARRDEALRRAQEIHMPVLLLCAEQDRIISLAAAKKWYERLQCQKRLVVFPDSYHELHHEPVRLEVLRLVLEWTLGHGS